MNIDFNFSAKTFYKKNVKIFEVENIDSFKLLNTLILLLFFVLLPILWSIIRVIAFPSYSSNILDFINSKNPLTYENQIIYTVSLIGFQIFSPIIGIFILFFTMKNKIFSSKIYILFLIYPIKLLISLIFSSFTGSIDGLNTFLIDFVYSIAVVVFVFFKDKRLQNMFKIAYINFWKSLVYIIVFSLIYFGILYFLFFITSLFGAGNNIGNQTIILSNLESPFAIVAIFFSVVIAAPLIEEIVYRMLLADIIGNRWYSYIITTTFFAFLHIQVVGDWQNILPYFALGLVNGFIYWKFNNISIPIIIHFLGNSVAFILLFTS